MPTTSNSQTVENLSGLLANSYLLYVKTHNYHWNVTGPMFSTLHNLFESQYTELAAAIDEIAERIRALGAYAPGSLSAFSELASVKEETEHPDAKVMIRNLMEDQERVVTAAKKVIESAEAGGDVVSADLATRRIDVHQLNSWMLGSHFE